MSGSDKSHFTQSTTLTWDPLDRRTAARQATDTALEVMGRAFETAYETAGSGSPYENINWGYCRGRELFFPQDKREGDPTRKSKWFEDLTGHIDELYSPSSDVDTVLRRQTLEGWKELRRAFYHEIALNDGSIGAADKDIALLSSEHARSDTLQNQWDHLKTWRCLFHRDSESCGTCQTARITALDLMDSILGYQVEPAGLSQLTSSSDQAGDLTDNSAFSAQDLDTALIVIPSVFAYAFTSSKNPKVPTEWLVKSGGSS